VALARLAGYLTRDMDRSRVTGDLRLPADGSEEWPGGQEHQRQHWQPLGRRHQ
jgi:hypothetical protein